MEPSEPPSFKLTSSLQGQYLPYEYSCYDAVTGRKRDPPPSTVELPPLFVHNVPKNTESLVLFVGDYDVKGRQVYCHLMLYNIDPRTSQITSESGSAALNDARKRDFAPLCPPWGETHSYYFMLFAVPRKIIPDNPENKSAIDWKMVETDLTKAINVDELKNRETFLEFKFTAPNFQETRGQAESQSPTESQLFSTPRISRLEARPGQ